MASNRFNTGGWYTKKKKRFVRFVDAPLRERLRLSNMKQCRHPYHDVQWWFEDCFESCRRGDVSTMVSLLCRIQQTLPSPLNKGKCGLSNLFFVPLYDGTKCLLEVAAENEHDKLVFTMLASWVVSHQLGEFDMAESRSLLYWFRSGRRSPLYWSKKESDRFAEMCNRSRSALKYLNDKKYSYDELKDEMTRLGLLDVFETSKPKLMGKTTKPKLPKLNWDPEDWREDTDVGSLEDYERENDNSSVFVLSRPNLDHIVRHLRFRSSWCGEDFTGLDDYLDRMDSSQAGIFICRLDGKRLGGQQLSATYSFEVLYLQFPIDEAVVDQIGSYRGHDFISLPIHSDFEESNCDEDSEWASLSEGFPDDDWSEGAWSILSDLNCSVQSVDTNQLHAIFAEIVKSTPRISHVTAMSSVRPSLCVGSKTGSRIPKSRKDVLDLEEDFDAFFFRDGCKNARGRGCRFKQRPANKSS